MKATKVCWFLLVLFFSSVLFYFAPDLEWYWSTWNSDHCLWIWERSSILGSLWFFITPDPGPHKELFQTYMYFINSKGDKSLSLSFPSQQQFSEGRAAEGTYSYWRGEQKSRLYLICLYYVIPKWNQKCLLFMIRKKQNPD